MDIPRKCQIHKSRFVGLQWLADRFGTCWTLSSCKYDSDDKDLAQDLLCEQHVQVFQVLQTCIFRQNINLQNKLFAHLGIYHHFRENCICFETVNIHVMQHIV